MIMTSIELIKQKATSCDMTNTKPPETPINSKLPGTTNNNIHLTAIFADMFSHSMALLRLLTAFALANVMYKVRERLRERLRHKNAKTSLWWMKQSLAWWQGWHGSHRLCQRAPQRNEMPTRMSEIAREIKWTWVAVCLEAKDKRNRKKKKRKTGTNSMSGSKASDL